ncbi:RNA helicase aquarius [Halotydeus destructor]|nr:RNA helicase aquarius [Halotydeus destructor]
MPKTTSEEIPDIANDYWSSSRSPDQRKPFDVKLIEYLYEQHIRGSFFDPKRILALELHQYLECYLWPNYEPSVSSASYVMSIVTMVNQKFRERVAVWDCFLKKPEHFEHFFGEFTKLLVEHKGSINVQERTGLLTLFTKCVNSIEVDLVRERIQKVISLPMWISLSDRRRETEFREVPKLKKFWNALNKKDALMDKAALDQATFERKFVANLIRDFFVTLDTIPTTQATARLSKKELNIVTYCERFLELLIDIEALLPTRRFFNALLDDMHVIVHCRRSKLCGRHDESKLFVQLLDKLIFYARFEIDDLTGEELNEQEIAKKHYNRLAKLQRLSWKAFPEKLKKFCLANISAIDSKESLVKHLNNLTDEELAKFAEIAGIIHSSENETFDRTHLLENIAFVYERVNSQLVALSEMPLYPTELMIWDENLVPSHYNDDNCLALPKLNLQFLTMHDYLLRNFHLFRLESTYEIRQDIEDTIFRMKPWRAEDGKTIFGGWARMALAISDFSVVEVRKPNIGQSHPSRVRAEVKVNLNVRHEIKKEWDGLRKHDVCFLVSVRPNLPPNTPFKYKEPFLPQVGLHYVRGCEVEGLLDPSGRLVEENSDRPRFDTDYRSYRVWLDANQYAVDAEAANCGNEDVYETFNIIVRRKPKENNFKAVLETIRSLMMNTKLVVPDWLHDVILGYGDPSSAHYSNLPSRLEMLDFNDTFLDFDHLKQSFPDSKVETSAADDELFPPFKIEYTEESMKVSPYKIPNRGPYPFEQPKTNSVRFTPTQTEAIKAGMNPGLTVVVGPPGTGKTDVAVQIIANIYRNFPEQRTLVVAHSNQALNQLFEKIMHLDVDERHLLRMGHGEEELETEKDFTRYGRVDYVLSKRLQLLDTVQKLAGSIGIEADVGYTCETASHFFLYHIYSRWEEYMSKLSDKVEDVEQFFPFKKFFEDAPQPIFKHRDFQEDLEIARGCYRHIKKIFTQLDRFKAFEMLRTGSERSRYLLVKEAKIIAMTCTHAALKRKELVDVGFQYDNILMEESAQILEIETFIPLLLQNPEHGHNRLKRWIMIGDHHQLPPVIKNVAFQKFGNMEQSLFTRFVRLGVPCVELDAQGRSRSSICSLWRWRYKQLADLPHVEHLPEYKTANTGFAFDYQLVNVESFNGIGESEPVPYFYQNLAEAEYVVATFMYMRVLGYPASKITILTTYNGQKHLLRDVIEQRCASNPFIGRPHKITTVDKFQGQQNDYILLSLVRTKTVGHLRDVRRLVVALSRARLGLYIFARVPVFSQCLELEPAFSRLTSRPQNLHLVLSEEYPTERAVTSDLSEKPRIIEDMPDMVQFVYQFYQERVEKWQKEKPEMFEEFNKATEPEPAEEPMDATKDPEPQMEVEAEEEEVGFEKLTEDDTGLVDQEIEVSDDE